MGAVKDLVAGAVSQLRMEKAYYRKPTARRSGPTWCVSLLRDPDGRAALRRGDDGEHHRTAPAAARLQHQALHDPLTGLPNRTLFFDRLDQALAAGAGPRVGVCYLDLDGFKADQRHPRPRQGRPLLQTVAHRLTDRLGDGHLVARMGGDEFVVLVENGAGRRALAAIAETALDGRPAPGAVAGQRDRGVGQRRRGRAPTAAPTPPS